MTLPPFAYHRVTNLDEAVSLLVEHGSDARLLAGGHSLLPLMRLRRASPRLLIDVGGLAGLAGITDGGDHVVIGALTRHHDIATSSVLAAGAPLLARAASLVGDPQVRNRGTIGGSLAHADPAGDLAVAVLVHDATLVATGPGGTRTIEATSFFCDRHRSALAPDEVLTEVCMAKATSPAWSYQRFSRRAQDWPTVAVAVLGPLPRARVALAGMGPVPVRALAVEGALARGASPTEAAALADRDTAPTSDLAASAEYRRHLARVLTRRALEEVAAT